MSTALLITLLLSSVILFEALGSCPKPVEDPCSLYYKINDCCAQSDCRAGDICCAEPCGNICRRQSSDAVGTPFVDGTECQKRDMFSHLSGRGFSAVSHFRRDKVFV